MIAIIQRSGISLLAALLPLAPCASLAKAQAAAEYAIGVSKSATGAAGVGNIMNRTQTKAADKISDNLKTAIHQSPAQVMKENRTALEKKAVDGGTLHFTSDPGDAAISVDGHLVARTPDDIKIPTGKHTIMISRPDRDQWTKQVDVAKGQTQDVDAKLVNTNPSVISLDFHDSKKQ